MAMPAATPALIERVEPYWAIEYRALARGAGLVGEPGAFLAEYEQGPQRQCGHLDRGGAGAVVDGDQDAPGRLGVGGERSHVRDVDDVHVTVGDHCPAPVPASTADDHHLAPR